MAAVMNVAEAKKRLSELINRVACKGERFLIKRRDRVMAALVVPDDLARLQEPASSHGLLTAVGAWAEFPELDRVITDIYRRQRARDRAVIVP